MSRWFDTRRVMMADEVEARFKVRPKPCPFCASRGVGLYMGPLPHVSCLACGADGPLADEGTRDDNEYRQYQAILKWNQRIAP